MTPRKWKSAEVLRVTGPFVRVGNFTGHSPDLPSSDGLNGRKETPFTPEVLEMITRNFKGDIPIFVNHPRFKGEKRIQRGRSFKIGQSAEDVVHEGYVWDPEGKKLITEQGYDKVSPEFDIQYDTQGNVVNATIEAIVYVKNPAISGTNQTAVAMAFDKQGTSEGNNMAPEVPPATPPQEPQKPSEPEKKPEQKGAPPAQPPGQPTQPPAQPVAPQIQYVTDPALLTQINELSKVMKDQASKLAEYDKVVPVLIQQNEKVKTDQIADIVTELKSMGVESPESMVEGLTLDGKIKALNAVQATLIKAMPITKGPNQMQVAISRAEKDKSLFTKVLGELGITQADYDRVMAGGEIIESPNKN
jgi:hypothetical protein